MPPRSGAVIAINAILGFTLELRARRAMEALMQLGASRATVVRDGALMVIDAERLVPGDLLDLAAGQTVPADARVVDETDLRTNEAALTGESLPVSKQAVSLLEADTSLADRTNMVYRGTTVSSGIARAVVTTTGNATEVGRIGVLTRSVHEQATPLERRLDALGRRLVWVAVSVAVLRGAVGHPARRALAADARDGNCPCRRGGARRLTCRGHHRARGRAATHGTTGTRWCGG